MAHNPPLDRTRFDWSLVRSFLAVVDAGSLTGTARRTGALQPTLSRHIAELEGQLGAPLFERTGRGVVPTAAALAIIEAARAMQDGADALGRSLAGQRQATTGVVRITTSQGTCGKPAAAKITFAMALSMQTALASTLQPT